MRPSRCCGFLGALSAQRCSSIQNNNWWLVMYRARLQAPSWGISDPVRPSTAKLLSKGLRGLRLGPRCLKGCGPRYGRVLQGTVSPAYPAWAVQWEILATPSNTSVRNRTYIKWILTPQVKNQAPGPNRLSTHQHGLEIPRMQPRRSCVPTSMSNYLWLHHTHCPYHPTMDPLL